ncbi:hypothetical protein H4O18_18810 [Arenibacter sp. BSSL-BM3]|uniref:Uncharacterized protein n=1 Tax=Arenibacter arenosicollis TaxID=2762274 RepID=A0ABR7QSA6_9FLAO|nr:hypothetical protein [Arenibacter arenosicollis]MBC8770058.1 hypothetical protein [Arenibacter arenosicollis]
MRFNLGALGKYLVWFINLASKSASLNSIPRYFDTNWLKRVIKVVAEIPAMRMAGNMDNTIDIF